MTGSHIKSVSFCLDTSGNFLKEEFLFSLLFPVSNPFVCNGVNHSSFSLLSGDGLKFMRRHASSKRDFLLTLCLHLLHVFFSWHTCLQWLFLWVIPFSHIFQACHLLHVIAKTTPALLSVSSSLWLNFSYYYLWFIIFTRFLLFIFCRFAFHIKLTFTVSSGKIYFTRGSNKNSCSSAVNCFADPLQGSLNPFFPFVAALY